MDKGSLKFTCQEKSRCQRLACTGTPHRFFFLSPQLGRHADVKTTKQIPGESSLCSVGTL